MRAMVQNDFRDVEAVSLVEAESLQDVPESVYGPRNVVEVAYRGLNRPESLQLEGPGPIPDLRLPHEPGMDRAGTVPATDSRARIPATPGTCPMSATPSAGS